MATNMDEANVRPAVKRFAFSMENVLRKHDMEKGASGWRQIDNKHLVSRLEVNLSELKASINKETPEEVMERCIDIANLAMMRFDNEYFALLDKNEKNKSGDEDGLTGQVEPRDLFAGSGDKQTSGT